MARIMDEAAQKELERLYAAGRALASRRDSLVETPRTRITPAIRYGRRHTGEWWDGNLDSVETGLYTGSHQNRMGTAPKRA